MIEKMQHDRTLSWTGGFFYRQSTEDDNVHVSNVKIE